MRIYEIINSDFFMNRELKQMLYLCKKSELIVLAEDSPKGYIKIPFCNVIIFEASHFCLTLKLPIPSYKNASCE